MMIFSVSCDASQCCPSKAKAAENKMTTPKTKEVKHTEVDTTTLDGVLEKLRIKTAALKSMAASSDGQSGKCCV